MNKRHILVTLCVLAVCFLLLATLNLLTRLKREYTVPSDTTAVDITGIYKGTFEGANSRIEIILILLADDQYQYDYSYIDIDPGTHYIGMGVLDWIETKDAITIIVNEEPKHFRIEQDTLILIDKEGNPTTEVLVRTNSELSL